MKKILMIIVVFCCSLFFSLSAAGKDVSFSGKCGEDLMWTLNPQTGVLDIQGSGAMSDFGWDDEEKVAGMPWADYRKYISSVCVHEGVTTIGGRAFFDCWGIMSVYLPTTLKVVAWDAFRQCNSLTEVHISDLAAWCNVEFGYIDFEDEGPGSYKNDNPLQYAHHLYLNKKKITDLIIPDGVKRISAQAFCGCTDINSVTIPSSVVSVGVEAFKGCSSLSQIEIPNSVDTIGAWAFRGCESIKQPIYNKHTFVYLPASYKGEFTIPNGIKHIAVGAFEDSQDLTNVLFPKSIAEQDKRQIENQLSIFVFNDSIPTRLEGLSRPVKGEIVIPNNVTIIGAGAFGYRADSITSIIIPNSVTTIEDGAFSKCNQLTSLVIPNSVTTIGKYVFPDSLRSVTLSNKLTKIDVASFDGCSHLKSIIIPNSVTEIGDRAFYGCSSLTAIDIPGSVTKIGKDAFWGCRNLKSVTLHTGLKTIESNAFSRCEKIFSLTVPNSVNSMGYSALGEISNIVYNGALQPASSGEKYWGARTMNGYREGFLIYKDASKEELWACSPDVEGIIKLPNSLKTIQYRAFENCEKITAIEIPQSVTDIGVSAFTGCKRLTSVNLPDMLVEINYNLFYNCANLQNVTIPNKVYIIKSAAFKGCSKLQSITIPSSVLYTPELHRTFAECDNLIINVDPQHPVFSVEDEVLFNKAKTILYRVPKSKKGIYVIPNTVTTIGEDAFKGCVNLTEIRIPKSVTKIEKGAFSGCTGIKSITIPNNVKEFKGSAFNGCSSLSTVIVGDSVQIWYERYFEGVLNVLYAGNHRYAPWGAKCKNGYEEGSFVYSDATKKRLIACTSAAKGEVIIPNGVKVIGEKAFTECNGITSVVIPNSVTQIEKSAFYSCKDLTKVTLNNTLKEIPQRAFYRCGNLTSIHIPNSVTKIGKEAFGDCHNLNSITIPSGLLEIEKDAFNRRGEIEALHISDLAAWCNIRFSDSYSNPIRFSKHLYVNGKEISELVIPESVKSISDYAFSGLNLTSVTIPGSVKRIGIEAFSGSSMKSISFSKGLTAIDQEAFEYCYDLTTLTIPNTVDSLGRWAFYGCEGLENVFYPYGLDWGRVFLSEHTKLIPYDYKDASFGASNEPPLLIIDTKSIAFTDASNDQQINAGEQCFVKFHIKNTGKGLAKNCEARVQMTGNTTGITIENVEIPIVKVGQDYEVSIPIIADTDIQDGTIKLVIEVYEPQGWGIAPFDITVNTKGYESPYLQVVDYKVASESGEIKKMHPFVLTFNLQNTQYGLAEDVHVNVEHPSEVYILDGQEEWSYTELKAGEVKPMSITFVVNNKFAHEAIPISINVHEKYGKFAENKQLNIALNETASSSITIVAQNKREEIVIAHLSSDVDRNIPVTSTKNPNTFVLILANEHYQQVAAVPYALNDGSIFREYCIKTLGISEKHIKYLSDATGNQLKAGINWLANLTEAFDNPQIIVYYAGHGIPNESSKTAYLLPVDGIISDMSTCYKLDDLYTTLGNMPASRITVFMDACFSGSKREEGMLASARGVALKVRAGVPQGNMVVFSAAQGDETAYPNTDEQHGMFTYYLLKKLQETKGEVTLQELGNYITTNVRQQSIVKNGKSQTPNVTPSVTLGSEWQNWKLK